MSAVLRVRLAAAVPGALVRALPALVVGAVVAVLGGGPVLVVLGLVAAALLVRSPGQGAAPAVVLVVGLSVLAGPDLRADPVRLAAVLLLVPAVTQTAALAAHVHPRAQVEAAVLGRLGLEVLAVQVPVQGLALLLGALPGAAAGARAVAVGAGVVAALVLVPVVRRAVRG